MFRADKAVLLVYDVTNRKSFADLSLWLEEFGCGTWMSSAGREQVKIEGSYFRQRLPIPHTTVDPDRSVNARWQHQRNFQAVAYFQGFGVGTA